MAGLIDSTTGLAFGTGLEFQQPIGGAGLIINAGSVPAGEMITEASVIMITEGGVDMITET